MIECAGRADEREPRLLFVAEDLDGDAGVIGDRARELLLIGGLADRRRGDRANRVGTELAREPHLGGDDLGDLGDLLQRDRVVAPQALADTRERALAQQLAQAAVGRLRDQQPRRVGADIDAAADHVAQAIGSQVWQERSGSCAMATRSPTAPARTSSAA